MSKFKVGDLVRLINQEGWRTIEKGCTYKISEVTYIGYKINNGTFVSYKHEEDFELAEDRSTWHPHHDVIVAWAKGARIRRRDRRIQGDAWAEVSNPGWSTDWEYEVIPEPDNTAEIAEIEQEMRKLADRLENLKAK